MKGVWNRLFKKTRSLLYYHQYRTAKNTKPCDNNAAITNKNLPFFTFLFSLALLFTFLVYNFKQPLSLKSTRIKKFAAFCAFFADFFEDYADFDTKPILNPRKSADP